MKRAWFYVQLPTLVGCAWLSNWVDGPPWPFWGATALAFYLVVHDEAIRCR